MVKSYLTKGKKKLSRKIKEIVSMDGIKSLDGMKADSVKSHDGIKSRDGMRSFQEAPDTTAKDRINAADLFSLFTASIIKKNVTFTR
jgi:hypothetical protein